MAKKFSMELPRHFIFNALNSAIALCRIDSDLAAKVLAALAQCMHYTSGSASFTSLEDECDFIASYLLIQSVRHSPKLSYRFQHETILPDFLISRFSLLHLIENGLKNRLPATLATTHLFLGTSLEEEQLKVRLEINQVLFAETKLKLYSKKNP